MYMPLFVFLYKYLYWLGRNNTHRVVNFGRRICRSLFTNS